MKLVTLFPNPTSISTVAFTPLVVEPPAATKGIFSYPVGASIQTVGGFVNVKPVPGEVTLTLVIYPLSTIAVPIAVLFGYPVAPAVPTPTYTV